MARRTKKQDREYVTVHYGIDPKRGTIETIWEQRDGVLVKSALSGVGGSHYPRGRNRAEHEIFVVWNLTDIFSTPVGLMDSESTKHQLEELRAKAEAMKAPPAQA